MYISGNGIGGLIAGQLLHSGTLSYPQLFEYGGIASAVAGLVFTLNFHTWGKRNKLIVTEKIELLHQNNTVGSENQPTSEVFT